MLCLLDLSRPCEGFDSRGTPKLVHSLCSARVQSPQAVVGWAEISVRRVPSAGGHGWVGALRFPPLETRPRRPLRGSAGVQRAVTGRLVSRARL